jgi:hypothetical protein
VNVILLILSPPSFGGEKISKLKRKSEKKKQMKGIEEIKKK